jgi:uncharacterized membrane protein YgaE (UPF0421/DUF939 family)
VEAFAGRTALGLGQAMLSVVSAFAAYRIALGLGLQDAFWAAITAIGVTQARLHDALNFGRRQFIGAVVGGAVGLGFALAFGDALWVYAAAVVVSITACAAINRGDSGQLAGITATIILLVPHTGSPETIAIARLSEVALGAATATIVVWIARRLKLAAD